jgi:hypothetical protein
MCMNDNLNSEWKNTDNIVWELSIEELKIFVHRTIYGIGRWWVTCEEA